MGSTTTSGKLQVHVWEMLLQEMATPGREVRWEHVPAHVNVQGNEVANGLAMEGMCSSPLWSQHVAAHSSSGSESTVGLRGGPGSDSEETKALWSSLGMVPMDSDELTGEASGEPALRGMGPYTSSSSQREDIRTGHTHQGELLNELSAAETLSAADTLSFSTEVSNTRRQRKNRKLSKRRNPGQGMGKPLSPVLEPIGAGDLTQAKVFSGPGGRLMRNSHREPLFLHWEERGLVKLQRTGRKFECIPQWEYIFGGCMTRGRRPHTRGPWRASPSPAPSSPLPGQPHKQHHRPHRRPPGRLCQRSGERADRRRRRGDHWTRAGFRVMCVHNSFIIRS